MGGGGLGLVGVRVRDDWALASLEQASKNKVAAAVARIFFGAKFFMGDSLP
jgi:hypothetical protein